MTPAFAKIRMLAIDLAGTPGEPQKREQLCRSLYPYITPLILRKTRRLSLPADWVEDAIQEALVLFYERIIDLAEKGRIGAEMEESNFCMLVWRTADNIAARERRRHYHLRRLALLSRELDSQFREVDLADAVARLIRKLDRSDRELLDYWCKGCSYRQAANELNLRESQARVRVSRIIKRLRKSANRTEITGF